MPFRDTLLVVSSRYNIPTRDDRTVNDRYKHFRKKDVYISLVPSAWCLKLW